MFSSNFERLDTMAFIKRQNEHASKCFATHGVDGAAHTVEQHGRIVTYVSMHRADRTGWHSWIDIAKDYAIGVIFSDTDPDRTLTVQNYTMVAAPPGGRMAVVAIVWDVL